MPQRHLESARQKLGAALLELRLMDDRRERIITRIERAYVEWVDAHASDDPQLIVDEL